MAHTMLKAAVALACTLMIAACQTHDPYYDYSFNRPSVSAPPPSAVPPRDIRPFDMRVPPPAAPDRFADGGRRNRPGVYGPPRAREFRREYRERGVIVRRDRRGVYIDVPAGVFFGLDSSAVRPQARRIIARVADRLRSDPRLEVQIRGFTDTSGTREHNQQLSEDRADAVAEELIGDGVDPGRIDARGFGESNLRVRTRDGVREPRNRRVEIILEPRPNPPPPPPRY
jgi:outer membrane protein OmpA-like peptidoglycan-associated protein